MLRARIICSLAPVWIVVLVAAAQAAERRQNLDEAVARQLENGCGMLLGDDDPVARLRGKLRRICSSGTTDPPPVSDASGGGAATPASLPGIIQQQQRERLLAAAEQRGGAMAASGDVASLDIGDRFSIFILGDYAAIDKNRNDFEDGYDSDVLGGTVGASYRIRSDVIGGLAFDYFHEDGGYNGGGHFETDSYGAIAFGAVTGEHLILQASGGCARRDYERTRPVAFEDRDRESNVVTFSTSGRASGDYGANVYFLEGAATSVWRWRDLTFSPFASLGWARVDYDSYAEKGDTGLELRFDDDDQTSLLSALGIGAATVFSTGPIALVPSIDVSWLHEFQNDQRTVEVSFVDDTERTTFTYSTEKPDRNFGLLRAGLGTVLPNGLRPFVQFQTVFANDNYSGYLVTVGLNFDL
jgi:Autotransporter beta-domain